MGSLGGRPGQSLCVRPPWMDDADGRGDEEKNARINTQERERTEAV